MYRLDPHPVTGAPERVCRHCGKYPTYCRCAALCACGHNGMTHSGSRGCYAYRCECQRAASDLPAVVSPFVRRALARELPVKDLSR